MTAQPRRTALPLRAGDRVVVRSREEILATLDAHGRLEGMPFMPEMLMYCGRSFDVAAIAHKTCDPAHKTGGRRLDNAVHLVGLRCDGSKHGNCEANCNLFFKTAWLRREGDDAPPLAAKPAAIDEDGLWRAAFAAGSTPEKPLYSCQATCLFDATRPLKWWHVGQYARDVMSHNVTVGHAVKFLFLSWLRALTRVGLAYRLTTRLYMFVHRLILGRAAPLTGGDVPRGVPTPVEALNLSPGQWVRVRSNEEIRQTLSPDSKNRGLWFDEEATAFCGQRFQVERRVQRIIHEVTGEMLEMKTPCITLKGVYCQSMYSRERLFCPRAISPYWREIWLRPDAEPGGGSKQ